MPTTSLDSFSRHETPAGKDVTQAESEALSPTAPATTRRVVSIWFPCWSVDLLLRRMFRRSKTEESRAEPACAHAHGHGPVLMTQPRQGRDVVAAACPLAAAAGVRIGMSLSHARALVRGRVIVAPWTPENDAQSLLAMASWCNRFSPTVGVDPPDGLTIDVTGTHRLHRGERRLLTVIRGWMKRLGFRSRLAIASTAGCARAASRHGDHPCMFIQPGGEAAYLGQLPIEAIDIAGDLIDALREMGLDRLDDIMRLPRASVPARFGPDVLERLDAALGRRADSIVPIRPKAALHVEHLFDGPTTHWESIEHSVHTLVDTLMEAVVARGMGVRRLEVRLLVTNRQPPTPIDLTLCRPSRSARHIWSMLRPHLERADMGDGIEGVTIAAADTGSLRFSQGDLHEIANASASSLAASHATARGSGCASDSSRHHDPDIDRAELCDTLMSRLGSHAVLRVFHVESHAPERTLRLVSFLNAQRADGISRLNPTPRPSRLFLRPEPIHVMHLSPDGPIHRLQWRDLSWSVSACIGPERICSPWWLTPPGETGGDRDYYRICIATEGLESRWIWIYRLIVPGTWHAHGEWA